MKPIRALALLVALSFTSAGCASGEKTKSDQHAVTVHNKVSFGPITVTETQATTIADVKTGTDVRCKGGTGANVPRRGVGASGSSGLSVVRSATNAPPPTEISTTHRGDGSITVTCKP